MASLQPAPSGQRSAPESEPFKNCLGAGDCYTWHDGVAGVVTPAVNLTTTFTLDIVKTVDGNRTVVGSLTTTVQVTMPWIQGNAYVEPLFDGRVLRLHWLAFNARYCTVQLDGVTVANTAPTDTYSTGYAIGVPDEAGPHTAVVIAHAAIGNALASFTFPEQLISPITKIVIGAPVVGAIAAVPKSSLALVSGLGTAPVTLIDVGELKAEPGAFSPRGFVWSLVATPDGKTALVVACGGEPEATVQLLDVSAGRLEHVADVPVVGGDYWMRSIAVTPDGTTALLTPESNAAVLVFDIHNRTFDAPIPMNMGAVGIAITSDGAVAVAANMSGGGCGITVIDLKKRPIETTWIPVGQATLCVAISPDNTLALVPDRDADAVWVLDIATRKVEAQSIPTGKGPTSIAITPDGFAVTANPNGLSLSIIDAPTLLKRVDR
jgi:YVTN family beta-propeller protein